MSSREVPDRSQLFTRLDMGMVDASPIARDNGIKLPVILQRSAGMNGSD